MRNCSLILFCLMAGIGICCHGCHNSERQTQLELEITGEVLRDSYVNVVRPSESQIAYGVRVSITNESNSLLIFDNIEASFFAERGTPFKQEISMRRKKPGQGTGEAFEPGIVEEIVIASGETSDLHNLFFSTNGYTESLLNEARGGALRFSIVFKLKGDVIAGPYIGILPNLRALETLPSKWEVLTDSSRVGYRLHLSRFGVSNTTSNILDHEGKRQLQFVQHRRVFSLLGT